MPSYKKWHNYNKSIGTGRTRKLLLPLCPLNYTEADYETDLLQETYQVIMKPAALETMHTLYPEQDWLHIYTDDSLTDRNGNAGAGIQCKLYIFYLSLV
jgi:hypothetical protein